jgi:rhamnosyltransferase
MRLALYAHYSKSGGLALYVLFYLRKLRDLGFQICFISNSPIPQSKEQELHELCEKIIQRENTGYDFAMWQQAVAEYELSQFDELLLTNSTIIGPLHPLEPLWQNAAASECDFWGLTDNDEFGHHLQSYFILFRRQALEHPCFGEFWRSVLPFKDKQLIIQSYEVGLSSWLEQHGLSWKAVFPQEHLHAMLLSRRGLAEKLKNRIRPLELPRNTPMLLPDMLLKCGMPFLKATLLPGGGDLSRQVSAEFAMRLLETSNIPKDVLDELRAMAG